MKIYRYISLAVCAAVAAVPFSGCSKGKKEPKVVNEPPVPIIEQESVSEAETYKHSHKNAEKQPWKIPQSYCYSERNGI